MRTRFVEAGHLKGANHFSISLRESRRWHWWNGDPVFAPHKVNRAYWDELPPGLKMETLGFFKTVLGTFSFDDWSEITDPFAERSCQRCFEARNDTWCFFVAFEQDCRHSAAMPDPIAFVNGNLSWLWLPPAIRFGDVSPDLIIDAKSAIAKQRAA